MLSLGVLQWSQSKVANAGGGHTIAKGIANDVSRHDQEAVSGYIFSI